MVCFQSKNPNLGKFWSAIDWKMLIYFMAVWNILLRFGRFSGHLVHFVFIWYIFSVFWYHVNLATLFGTICSLFSKTKKTIYRFSAKILKFYDLQKPFVEVLLPTPL
jgi:hypothetical protein